MSSLSCSSSSSYSSTSSSGPYHYNGIYKRKISNNRYQILPYAQICRLQEVLDQKLLLASSITGLPTIELNLRQFLHQIRKHFEAMNLPIEDMRLNGGAASFVIGPADASSLCYSDLDLIISMDTAVGDTTSEDMQRIRSAVLSSIMKNGGVNHSCINNQHHCDSASSQFLQPYPHMHQQNILPESYIHKQVRVNDASNGDVWSLISLGSNYGDSRIVELKLVYQMRRKYEFSVDSFQIKLDSLLSFLERGCAVTPHFYPTVVAESVWGSFQEACRHLENRLIMTHKPEEIRGGGLLKYCKLLTEGYRPHPDCDTASLERYMCSRFFIDFPDLGRQRHKLLSYLVNHFVEEARVRVRYLQTLELVVSNSTVCLMNHERYQTLSLIGEIIYEVWNRAQTPPLHIELFSDARHWVLDHVFYGSSSSKCCLDSACSLSAAQAAATVDADVAAGNSDSVCSSSGSSNSGSAGSSGLHQQKLLQQPPWFHYHHYYADDQIDQAELHHHHMHHHMHHEHHQQQQHTSSPTSLVQTPSEQSPTEPTASPTFPT